MSDRNVQIEFTKTSNHLIIYITSVYIHVLVHTFYSMVRWIYLYILVVFYSCLVSVLRYIKSICICTLVWDQVSPSRLLLLFKGLAAPSPLKQKEKRDWVRLRPSNQHLFNNYGGKTTGKKCCTFQIWHKSMGIPQKKKWPSNFTNQTLARI